ncbi:DUF2218 domain-containing protein [Leisingera sp.]|uniref:DUF2218 domain-containing protein n=1 Tax=Leisingera sp. TaxID=1879318 RepID=UPI003A918D0F
MRQTGRFETVHASKYMRQLCKHFAHKVPAACDETEGCVQFPFGPATLHASATELRAEITSPDNAALERGRAVIDSHLKTFAFREGFNQMDWAAPTEG